ncbi:NCS2 family permease [Mycoplasma todarodis]|uniref:NCS2 family permease n=1 Tax=Mycoplasma todarodis TaxID=1937191 RepID=UPI003B303368
MNKLRKYFEFDSRKAILKKEIIGGISTFVAMAYILAVNPSLLSSAKWSGDASKSQIMGGLFLATAISAFFATMVMGLYANIPLGLAPGMGVNAFFAFTVASSQGGMGLTAQEALAATFFSGLLYFIIAMSPFRRKIMQLIPKNLKLSLAIGVGFFLAIIGLNDAGIIRTDAFTPAKGVVVSNTIVKMGDFSNPFVILSVCTLFLMIIFKVAKVPAGMLLAMVIAAITFAIMTNTMSNNKLHINHKDWGGLIRPYGDLKGIKHVAGSGFSSMGSALGKPMTYVAILTFLYQDFFDTTGTLNAFGKIMDLPEPGTKKAKWFRRANHVDAVGTVVGSAMGTSTVTSYLESSVGISSGAKTGVASIVTGSLFLIAIAAWPIMGVFLPVSVTNTASGLIFPVTAPALVIVGMLMFGSVKHFNWKRKLDVIPLFIGLMMTMLGYSISLGMAFAFVTHSIVYLTIALKQAIWNKRGKTLSNHVTEGELKENLFKTEINWMVLSLSVLALVYIATIPLYA